MRRLNKIKRSIASITLLMFLVACGKHVEAQPDPRPTPEPTTSAKKIKIALLLDTSNSMDGLINQAKSQLWKIVNELALAKCEGERPIVKIALYEYGNDRLTASEGYIRMVTPLTNDLDQISQDLFGLTTNGGSEFCGHVIKTALNQLDWGNENADLKLMFIAGNEPFTQGSVSYTEVCNRAKTMGITVNTIFCGDFNEGISTSWKSGADLTGGYYMSIAQNSQTVYTPSPFDDKIEALNDNLNKTYIQYGSGGRSKKLNQATQDANAASYSKQNKVSRAVSKSSHIYDNKSWDLVDKSKEKSFKMEEVEEEYLPAEMKGMNDDQKSKYVENKKDERVKIQNEIKDLNVKRLAFVAKNEKTSGTDVNQLDKAMISAIRSQAKSKDFKFDK